MPFDEWYLPLSILKKIMAKYSEHLVERIVELMETDLFSIAEICRKTEISPKTFYEWKQTKPEFKIALEKAAELRDEALFTSARIGLKQLLEGYTVKEEKVIYVPARDNPACMEKRSIIIKKKHYPPSIRAIKMVLDKNDKTVEKEKLNNESILSPIIVKDEETKRQLMILRENNGEPGGALKPEIVDNVDSMLEIERTAHIAKDTENTERVSKEIKGSIDYKSEEDVARDTSNISKAIKAIHRSPTRKIVVTDINRKALPPGYYR